MKELAERLADELQELTDRELINVFYLKDSVIHKLTTHNKLSKTMKRDLHGLTISHAHHLLYGLKDDKSHNYELFITSLYNAIIQLTTNAEVLETIQKLSLGT